jgi:hypothetical protein
MLCDADGYARPPFTPDSTLYNNKQKIMTEAGIMNYHKR